MLTLAAALGGCMPDAGTTGGRRARVPALPEKLETGEDGVPTLSVYDMAAGKTTSMDLETYVAGVTAGEMKNDWPMEALKAQAILARTFTLKFCTDKTSRHAGADISTDVAEAQAYDAASVNARVRKAVRETRGMVLNDDGRFASAWFHAHSGGMTERPSVALDYRDGDPDYLKPIVSTESEKAPDSAKQWNATFTKEEVRKAAADAGTAVEEVTRVEIGERGESGRAKTLRVNGENVSAPSFRIRIGASRLRSTLIDAIEVEGDQVTFTGRGFGHGVGMSQWGAYEMAENGKTAEEIIAYYYPGISLEKIY